MYMCTYDICESVISSHIQLSRNQRSRLREQNEFKLSHSPSPSRKCRTGDGFSLGIGAAIATEAKVVVNFANSVKSAEKVVAGVKDLGSVIVSNLWYRPFNPSLKPRYPCFHDPRGMHSYVNDHGHDETAYDSELVSTA